MAASGMRLSEPRPLDEPDADDILQATMDLAARAGEAVTFRDCAEAVDEMALSRTPAAPREPSSRAAAVVALAGRFPGSGSPAGDELELELARRREVDCIAREHLGQAPPPEDWRVADIVARNPGMLSGAPRRGMTHVTTVTDPGDLTDRSQPAKGGQVHPEVRRLLEEHGAYFHDPNSVTPVKSARQREREQHRATTRQGMFSIEQLHRQALRSASSGQPGCWSAPRRSWSTPTSRRPWAAPGRPTPRARPPGGHCGGSTGSSK